MDNFDVRNDLTVQVDRYLDIIDTLAEEGDQWALKMIDILYVGRAGFCRAIILNGDEGIRGIQKGFPGFTYIELRELANKIRVHAMVERLT